MLMLIDLVQSIPEKSTLSMTDILNSSSKHRPRSRDRSLKKVSKITSPPTIKNRVRSFAAASSDSSPDSSHRSSPDSSHRSTSSQSFEFSYSIPSRRISKVPSSSPQRSQSRSISRSKSPNRFSNQGHRNRENTGARKDSASFF